MSLKETIEFWKKGVDEAEKGRHSEAIKSFMDMPEPGSRIYFNVANMYVSLGSIEEAEEVRERESLREIYEIIVALKYCVHVSLH